MKLAYADPPYPGRAHLYKNHADFAGEVDHAELLERLERYDGWALSTNSDSLRDVLEIAPAGVQVAAWVRTNAPPFNPDGRGAVRSWEPVIYVPARLPRNDATRVRDVLACGAPTGTIGRGLTGTKPDAFSVWVFNLIGATGDDDLADLFPGSGAVGRAWEKWRGQGSLFAGALGGHRSGEHMAHETPSLLETTTG